VLKHAYSLRPLHGTTGRGVGKPPVGNGDTEGSGDGRGEGALDTVGKGVGGDVTVGSADGLALGSAVGTGVTVGKAVCESMSVLTASRDSDRAKTLASSNAPRNGSLPKEKDSSLVVAKTAGVRKARSPSKYTSTSAPS